MGLELKIDLYALDTEVVNQPALYHEHATKLADARKAETAAKTNMELVKAQTTNSVKTDWREWGLAQSPTVQTVDATVLESEDYQDAQRRYHAAQHEVRILVAAVDALEHKRRMISQLLTCYVWIILPSPTSMVSGLRYLPTNRPAAQKTPLADEDDARGLQNELPEQYVVCGGCVGLATVSVCVHQMYDPWCTHGN